MSVLTKEIKLVLGDFSRRVRVHKGVPVSITRMYNKLVSDGHEVDKAAIDQAFIVLDQMGYGKVVKSYRGGGIKEFIPRVSVRSIGQELLPKVESGSLPEVVKPIARRKVIPDTVARRPNVVVFFKLRDRKCRAEIPEDVLPEFERLIN